MSRNEQAALCVRKVKAGAAALLLAFLLAGGMGFAASAPQQAYAQEAADYPFTASVGTSVLEVSDVQPNAYSYIPYNAPVQMGTLYTVVIPKDATKVNLTFAENCLAYNYDGKGTYLDGFYDDYTAGSATATVDVDANDDGVLDFIQVQDVYNADWSGADLRYAITFVREEISSAEIDKAQDALSARFARGGADQAIDNGTFYAALALNKTGNGANVDTARILSSLNQAKNDKQFSAGRYAKYILALSAGGYDCTSMVAEMEKLIDLGALDVYSAVCILPVYQTYAPGNEDIEDGLINVIKGSQKDGGLIGGEAQTTAQAILALLPYNDREEVSTVIDNAQAAIDTFALGNGTYANNKGSDEANLDATATIVMAYAAMGQDCGTSLRYLLDASDKGDGAGYGKATLSNESMSAATAFAAFVAGAGKGSIYDLDLVTPTFAGKTVTYNGKAASVSTVYGTSAKPSVTYYADSACTKKLSSCVNAGTYYAKMTVAGTPVSNQATSVVKLTIKKASQKVSLKKTSAAKKYSAAKKGKYKGKLSSTRSVSAKTVSKTFGISSKGSRSYSRSYVTKAASKYVKVSRSGAVQVKKGLKKGTYTLKIKVSAKSTTNYNAASARTITYKIKVA